VDARKQRGLEIAAVFKIVQKGKVWIVPSQTSTALKYTVCPDKEHPHCTCPDHDFHGGMCKHLYAVEFVIQREFVFNDVDEMVAQVTTISQTVKKTTYTQNWRAYNAAQTTEKSKFQALLHDLCKGIESPQAVGRGRPRLPLADALFAAVFKVYSTKSGRRFIGDLQESKEKGYIRRAPCYNSIFNVFEDEQTTEILKSLVIESAAPLKAIEEHFSCDSSGFSGSRFDKWYDHKFNQKRIKRSWVKVHVMCGTKTNVVTAVEIAGQNASDQAFLKPLLKTTKGQFNIKELSADMAYSTYSNLEAIDAAGAAPLIPFKKNAISAKGGTLWAKMLHYFKFKQDEFMARYHQRSNVESTFSMIKAKFGDSVRSKTDVAMKNEALAKLVCHNICCVIQSMYEFGADPIFWAETSVAQQVGQIG
jgi:transposase